MVTTRFRLDILGLLRKGAEDAPVRTEPVALNAYGKLPIYKDFISAGLTEEPAREFREWLSNGFSHRWATREETLEETIAPHGFLFSLPSTKRSVAGVLWGSHDQGGLRRFPFTLFIVLPTRGALLSPLTATAYLARLDSEGADVRGRYGDGTLASFYAAYRGKKLEVPVPTSEQLARALRSDLSGVTVSDFAEGLLGEDAKQGWPLFLEALAKKTSLETTSALRLPVASELPVALQLQLWLLRNSARAPSGLLYPLRGRGHATLLFRTLHPDDIFLLAPTPLPLERIDELQPKAAEAVAPPEGEPKAEEEAKSAETPAPAGWGEPLASLIP